MLVDKRTGGQQRVSDGLGYHECDRCEIENYVCFPEVLDMYARQLAAEQKVELFATKFLNTMQECVRNRVPPAALQDRSDAWWSRTRASEDFLALVFVGFFAKLELPNLMRKTDYHRLATLVPKSAIGDEVIEVLDRIVDTANAAKPRR